MIKNKTLSLKHFYTGIICYVYQIWLESPHTQHSKEKFSDKTKKSCHSKIWHHSCYDRHILFVFVPRQKLESVYPSPWGVTNELSCLVNTGVSLHCISIKVWSIFLPQTHKLTHTCRKHESKVKDLQKVTAK